MKSSPGPGQAPCPSLHIPWAFLSPKRLLLKQTAFLLLGSCRTPACTFWSLSVFLSPGVFCFRLPAHPLPFLTQPSSAPLSCSELYPCFSSSFPCVLCLFLDPRSTLNPCLWSLQDFLGPLAVEKRRAEKRGEVLTLITSFPEPFELSLDVKGLDLDVFSVADRA